MKYLCEYSSYVFPGQYLPTSAENNEECCGENEESQQFHCKLRHFSCVSYRTYFILDIACFPVAQTGTPVLYLILGWVRHLTKGT